MTATSPSIRKPFLRRLTLAGLWAFLTEPSPHIQSAEIRRRARLLSALLLPIMALGLISSTVVPLVNFGRMFHSPADFITLGGTILIAATYGVSRTRYYAIAAVTLVLLTSAGAVASVISDSTSAERLLAYLTVAVLLASMLLSVRETVAVAILNLLATLGLKAAVPELPTGQVVSAATFQLFMDALIVIFSAIRANDLRQIEQQSNDLARAVKEAREANQLKSEFLATMSHELRTPLNAIIGFAEVMMMGLAGELAPQAKHSIERVHHNSERLLALIDDILDISKIEAGRLEVSNQPFEPSALLSSLQASLSPQARKKDLNLVMEVDESLPPRLIGDFQRVEQIALNLGSNAIKFTDKGCVDIALKRVSDTEWGIVVTDTGIGIPSHARDLIFEKFRQVDGSSRRAYGGTGLGLAITKELALLLRGTIKVESEVGSGSIFTVTLPIQTIEGTKN